MKAARNAAILPGTCQLWVIFGVFALDRSCPLAVRSRPPKRTCLTSDLCQQRTNAVQQKALVLLGSPFDLASAGKTERPLHRLNIIRQSTCTPQLSHQSFSDVQIVPPQKSVPEGLHVSANSDHREFAKQRSRSSVVCDCQQRSP